MIGLDIFLLGLTVSSTLNGLVTQAIKMILDEMKKTYYPNLISAIVSVVLSGALGGGYFFVNDISFASKEVIYIVAMMFMSWLSAMVGYDKVVQAITQFKLKKQ